MSIGAPLPHDSAALHVLGTARYIDDIPTPAGTLHLAFGLSTIAHGTIAGMDLAPVRAAPGVVAVLTAADLPHANDVGPAVEDEPLLATGIVQYAGQPLFLVVATSHLAARKAARLGRIDYLPIPAILTIDQALAAGSRYEGGPVIWARGDAGAAISGAAHVVEGVFETGAQEHFYLEGQAALALPGEDAMVVHASSQHPTEVQHKVAAALGCPFHAVRVEVRRMGGGFGGKESQGNALAVAAAVAARATGRACKMRYDRDDDMLITGKRHDFRVVYRAGFDAEARLCGVEFTHFLRCGWSQDLSLPVADRAMLHADNAYFIPAMRIESHRLRTHTQSATAFRGFGGPQGMIGIERVMEHAAQVLGIDPLDLRRRNFYAEAGGPSAPPVAATGRAFGAENLPPEGFPGAPHPPEDISLKQCTHYGQEVVDFELGAIVTELEKSADFAARWAEIRAWNSKSRTLKRGIALTPVKFGISFTLTHLNQAGALVQVYGDGSVGLSHGGTEMGQGLHRKIGQVAAAAFGIGIEAVRVEATDTAKVPNTSATAASSGADLNGMAVKAACDTIRGRIAGHLAGLAGVEPREVHFEGGRVFAGARELAFAEAVASAHLARISLSATGFYATPDLEWDRKAGRGRPFYYFAYGAAVSEVVIDTLTGENRILRADILHDAGASLNPALDIGQIEGGFVQGAGWLTTEELVWDDAGRLRTHAPSTYKIPASSDRPRIFNVALWPGRNRAETIHRSKAVGEPPLMLAISVHQALGAACAACGPHWPGLSAPATPEAVLAAVARARGA
ncbi:MAG: xanthine dehydrogenase molybdopterin binding subunit [Rhodobacteraceae bacterium]|nr:xanthine dehydrogenase molybdopterin binding subunit [Paracoccaceae bacterium]